MLKLTKTTRLFAILCLGLTTTFLSCAHIGGAIAPPTTLKVIVTNPEYNTEVGFSNAFPKTYSPGFELEIKVSTLNSNNQAVNYSTKVTQFSHSDIVSRNLLTFAVDGISIPQSGAYVVEYTLRSQDCTWPNTQNCTNTPNGTASKKYFHDTKTITSGNPGTYQFTSGLNFVYYQQCC